MANKGSAVDLAQEIKAIEKKIRHCQQKLEREKKRKAEGTANLMQSRPERRKIVTSRISRKS